jgi:hypothetical protein
MRFCVGVSNEREDFYTFQYAEPCLAHAAMRLTVRFGWGAVFDNAVNFIGETAGTVARLKAIFDFDGS